MNFKQMAAVIAALVGIDQLVKWLVETRLDYQALVDFVPFISLYRTWNEGVAFSMLAGMDDKILVLLTIAIIAFVFWLARQTAAQNWLARAGFALIIGGAIGNLIDRSIYGHVVDYILFHTATWEFAVFNLADAFISVGAATIIFAEFLDWRRSKKQTS
jgi:signal peptidase II